MFGSKVIDFMGEFVAVQGAFKVKPKSARRVKWNTWQIRSAVFAIRAYIDFERQLKQKERQKWIKAGPSVSIARLNRVILSLERHTKRADRALIKTVGKEQFAMLKITWKAHLRWMRLRIAYFKPWGKPLHGRRARFQRDLDELMEIAKRGIREEGFEPPEDKVLRHIMRLYVRYARKGRFQYWIVGSLHQDKDRFLRKYLLSQFVMARSKLRRLTK